LVIVERACREEQQIPPVSLHSRVGMTTYESVALGAEKNFRKL
jgi:hypothetical protein